MKTPQSLSFDTMRFAAAVLAAALLLPARPTLANTAETLLVADGAATSSISGTTNWTPVTTVAMTNPLAVTYDYTDAGSYSLRTPQDGNNYTVYADAVTIGSGTANTSCALGFKGYGVITIPNLILNGGAIKNSGANATGYTTNYGILAGGINLETTSYLYANGAGTGMNIQSTITNAAGLTPALSLTGGGILMLSAANTFNGSVTVQNSAPGTTLQLGANNALPANSQLNLNGGANVGNAALDLNGHSTTISNLVFSSGTYVGYVTNSAFGTTGTLTLGYGNATETLANGIITDNPAAGGTVAVTKTGTGTLTLSAANSYSGATTISAGTLKMGSGTALPGPGRGGVIDNATLDLGGYGETIGGLSGTGVVDVSGGTAGVSYTLTVAPASNTVSIFNGVIQNTLGSAYVGFNMYGTNAVESLTGINTFNGNIRINAGALWANSGSALGTGPKTVYIQNGADAELHLNGTNGNISFPANLSFFTANPSGGGALVNEAGTNVINGTVGLTSGGSTLVTVNGGTLTLAGGIGIANQSSRNLTLGGAGNGTVSGIISNGVFTTGNGLSLTKAGTGTWTLSAADSYTDVTTINSGTLALGAAGSLAGTPSVSLQSNATFDVSATGGWTLGGSQTLGGTGNVNGSVTASGAVAPGTASDIGTLTFSNNLALAGTATLKLNRTNSPGADVIAVNGSLTVGGTLTVTNIGDPLQLGDAFTIFNSSGAGGTFGTVNLPALAGGLVWNTSQLASAGIIKVVSAVVPQPYLTGFSLAGTNLVINGTNGTAGQGYSLLASTNLLLPLTNWTLVATNTFGGGTFILTNPASAGAAQMFYILRVP